MKTLIRVWLRLTAHRVERIERRGKGLVVRLERIGRRRLRCGRCGRKALRTRGRRPERRWRDLPIREYAVTVVYALWRVECPRCGVRVERIAWATPYARLTRALARAVAVWTRRLSWKEVGELFGLGWRTVADAVEWAVDWGLKHRQLERVRVLGVDEVSRAKGQRYFTLFWDLKHEVLLWVGQDRTEATVEGFFAWFGQKRARLLRAVSLDMWAPYVTVLGEKAKQAVLVFDRFHLIGHLNRALDEVRRAMVRKLTGSRREEVKGSRYLWLKNPWNLKDHERLKLGELLKVNLPIVRAYVLKEAFQKLWDYRVKGWARKWLRMWFWMATHSRLKPLRDFAWLVRRHEEGILAWVDLRISNGLVEGMNNKVKTVAKRAYGYRTPKYFRLAIYHCLAGLPLPP